MIKRLLVAIDGSEHAAKALDLASEIAGRFEAELVAVHVISDKPLSDAERKMAEVEFQGEVARDSDLRRLAEAGDMRLLSQRLAEQAAETASRFRFALGERLVGDATRRAGHKGARNVRTLLLKGDPASAILGAAQQETADIIVLGRRGLGDLAGLLLGSVSHKISHLAECACLTVR
jgi:nucleotide-binding universal stress UspA family protein